VGVAVILLFGSRHWNSAAKHEQRGFSYFTSNDGTELNSKPSPRFDLRYFGPLLTSAARATPFFTPRLALPILVLSLAAMARLLCYGTMRLEQQTLEALAAGPWRGIFH